MPFKKSKELVDTDNENSENEQIVEEEKNKESSDIENEQIVESSNKKTKVTKPRKKEKIYKTEDGNEVKIIRKSRAKKPIVVYMSESEEEEQKVVVKPKPKKGRPKKKESTIVEYVDQNGNSVSSRNRAKKTIINHPEKLSSADIKILELEEKLQQLEAVSGKKILATKRGKPDARQTKAPTEKQLEARKKFAEANRLRHAKKRLAKEENEKQKQKSNVKVVVEELTEIKKQKAVEKEKIIKEIEEKKEKEEPKKKMNDNLFD